MAIPEPEATEKRRTQTILLMAVGAVSLLIPLVGVIYMHFSQNAGASGPSGRSDVFERREVDDRKIVPTQSAVVTSPASPSASPAAGTGAGASGKTQGSSLDFIKSSAELQARVTAPKAAAGPAASTAPVAAAPVAAAKPAVKPGKKPFVMPKLKPSRGFTNFGSAPAKGGANASAQQGSPAATADFLKNLPPAAANDPQVQQYLKSQQQAQ